MDENPTGADPTEPTPGDAGLGDSRPDDATAHVPPDAPPSPGPRRLRRDPEHRLLGGVAAGLACYFEVDVVVIRVVFAALTLLAGFGAALYLVGWVLMPAEGEDEGPVQRWAERRPSTRNLVVIIVGLVIAAIAVSDLLSAGPWWPHPNGGIGLLLGGLALGLALALVAGSGGNRTTASRLRWLLLTVTLTAVAVVIVAAATLFSVEAASGVPLTGGIGNSQWHPTTARQVAPRYRLAIGNLDVDLSAVSFPAGSTTHVTASVGIGRLVVEVPPGASVSVAAHSGLGDVSLFGRDNAGWNAVQTAAPSALTSARTAPRVVLNADTGVGQVEVIRSGEDFSY
jgi:phage shock protein PspC (stress-responsive transcriptional regulator)